MPTSTAVRSDPSALGQTNYPRAPLDHYATPPRATRAFCDHPYVRSLLYGKRVWEPACGNGAISKVLKDYVAPQAGGSVWSTDLRPYDGFDPDGLGDFLSFYPTSPEVEQVDGIVTNPPYGDEAEAFVRQALKLMKPTGGFVAMLMRHEWDCAKGRADLFDSPAFAAKLTLRFRPVWIEKKAGEKSASPRFSFAWYIWDWDRATSGQPPMSLYAG